LPPKLVEALQDCLEALLSISAAEGPDHADLAERAILCVRHNQKIAHDVLIKHGFAPRRELVK
jgi:hypothetical protein